MPKIHFYSNANNRSKVLELFYSLDKKVRAKILTYINLLINNRGKLGYPYCRKIDGKIWELRVDFDKNYYRLFYFIFNKEKIIILHGFNKKTNKTPEKEITAARNRKQDYLKNLKDKIYEF